MGKGFMGKVLHVDLSTGKIEEETIADEVYEKVLSGAGLAARILFQKIPKGADPLGPEGGLDPGPDLRGRDRRPGHRHQGKEGWQPRES